jgi:xanthine/CO dehydrogenase XdhC/CoxF family maturation factor
MAVPHERLFGAEAQEEDAALSAPPAETVREHESPTGWRVCICCGEEIELILWVLGSVRCMDCRVEARLAPLPPAVDRHRPAA